MKSSVLKFATACIALVVAAGRAHAADITAIKLDKGGTALLLIGEIKRGDGAKFRSEASKYDDGYVLLESDGGSLADAIDIGETIRLKGYATAVINDSSCNSACALIWLAGTPRALSKSGRIGFHAAYTDISGSARESGVANAMVGRYLTLLNLPEKALIFATSSPPSELSWLTASNYLRTGIELSVIDDFDLANDHGSSTTQSVEPPPLIQVETVPSKAKNDDPPVWKEVDPWTVYVDPSLDQGCFLVASFQRDTVLRVGVNRSSGGYYVVFGNPAWQSLKTGQSYAVQFRFGSYSPWDVPTIGVNMGGTVFLKSTFNDGNFWKEFASSATLDISRNNQTVTQLTLTGARQAFDELVNCQKYEDTHKHPKDPFAQ